jgi:glycosyltransferase involved in cell wall biosynthesis
MTTTDVPTALLEGSHNHPQPRVQLPTVDIVIPVLNEAATLARSVRRLRQQLAGAEGFRARVVIADNGSTDDTLAIAGRLSSHHADVSVIRLPERGRGRALRTAWLGSHADVVAYMDVDLSTDVSALPELIALVTRGGADVAIGSRLADGAEVVRSVRREFISRCYNRLLRSALQVGFRDAQCGFKALRADTARRLLPQVQDDGWFFDTELLVRAEQSGLQVVELPVRWTEDTDSRVAVARTAWLDLQGIRRLRAERRNPRRLRLLRFAGVGLVSTAAYTAMFVGFERVTPAVAASCISLVLSTAVNTEMNRRFTFGIRGGTRRLAAHVGGLTSLAVALLLTTAALGLVQATAGAHAAVLLQLVAVLVATVIATVVRYVLLERCATFEPGHANRPPSRSGLSFPADRPRTSQRASRPASLSQRIATMRGRSEASPPRSERSASSPTSPRNGSHRGPQAAAGVRTASRETP